MRYHARRAVRSICVVSCLGLISYGLIGCGGGSDGGSTSPSPSPSVSPTPTATPTPSPALARVVIAWGTRSRVEGLSSAISAKIVMSGAKVGGGDLIFTAERPITPGSASEPYKGSPSVEYVSTDQAITGKPFPLTITFYSDPALGGTVVGTAQANATVKADGSIDSTIATYGTIRSVVVEANQTVIQGQTVPLRFTALAADGTTPIMVRPGSARITIASGSDKVAIVGDAIRGLKPRDASVVVSIDQATSASTPLFVLSDTLITPNVTALNISIEKTFTFTATVTGSSVSDTGVTWALVGTPTGVTLTPTGTLTVGRTPVTFNVTATSNFDTDPSKVVTIPVTVASKVRTTILDKTNAIVGIGDKIRLVAQVSDPDGTPPDTNVTWQVVDKVTGRTVSGQGTVDSDGYYTAPTTAGSYRVLATSTYDTSKTDFVDVDVRAGSIGVGIQ